MTSNPSISADELETLSLLQNYWPDLPITIEQLRNPTYESIIDIYRNILLEFDDKLCSIGGINVNEFYRDVDNADPLWIFARIKYLLKECNVNFFNVFDLYKPNPKRTATILKFLMNFLLYLENKFDSNEESHVVKLTGQLNAVQETNTVLENEISQLAISFSKHQIELEQVEKDLQDAQACYKEIESGHKMTDAKNQNMKEGIINMEKQFKEKEELLANIINNFNRMSEQIVDEEQMLKLLALERSLRKEISETSEAEENEMMQLETKKQQLNCFSDLLKKIESSLTINLDLVFSVTEKQQRLHSETSDLKSGEREVEALLSKQSEIQQSIVRIQHKIQHVRDTAKNLLEKHKIMLQTLRSDFDKELIEKERLDSMEKDLKSKIVEVVSQADKWQQETEAVKQLILTEYEAMLTSENNAIMNFQTVLQNLSKCTISTKKEYN